MSELPHEASCLSENAGRFGDQIWNKVKALVKSDGEGLSREQFSVALRLVAFAQTEAFPSSEAIIAAASPQKWLEFCGKPLPPPRLAPDPK
jgi:hypothetical protein